MNYFDVEAAFAPKGYLEEWKELIIFAVNQETKIMRDFEKTIGNMADKLKTTFIGSVDDEGYPNIKAMLQPRKREGIKVFYFSTNTSSMRVGQLLQNDKACVYFCDNRFFRGALLRGTIEVLTDASSKEMIWRQGDTEYYAEGVTDPDYCVLKFTAMSGRFYSNYHSENFEI